MNAIQMVAKLRIRSVAALAPLAPAPAAALSKQEFYTKNTAKHKKLRFAPYKHTQTHTHRPMDTYKIIITVGNNMQHGKSVWQACAAGLSLIIVHVDVFVSCPL